MKICMVGEGAFGKKHLAALKNIEDVEVTCLVGGVADVTEAVASEFGVPHWTTDLQEGLAQDGVEAAILATPTPIHASQAIEVMQAGKHVEVEIPMAESLADAERVVAAQQFDHVLTPINLGGIAQRIAEPSPQEPRAHRIARQIDRGQQGSVARPAAQRPLNLQRAKRDRIQFEMRVGRAPSRRANMVQRGLRTPLCACATTARAPYAKGDRTIVLRT